MYKKISKEPRKLINRHSSAFILLAIACIIGSIRLIIHELNPPQALPSLAYFYDLETDSLYVAAAGNIPIVDVHDAASKAASTGPRAFVFACKDCSEANDRYVGWLEYYTPEAAARLMQPTTQPMNEVEEGHFILRPDPTDPDWKKKPLPFMSNEGVDLVSASMRARCPAGLEPQGCSPSQDTH